MTRLLLQFYPIVAAVGYGWIAVLTIMMSRRTPVPLDAGEFTAREALLMALGLAVPAIMGLDLFLTRAKLEAVERLMARRNLREAVTHD